MCVLHYHLCGLVEILKMSNLVTNFSFVVKVKNDGKNFILRLKFKCTPGTLAKADGKLASYSGKRCKAQSQYIIASGDPKFNYKMYVQTIFYFSIHVHVIHKFIHKERLFNYLNPMNKKNTTIYEEIYRHTSTLK